MPAMVPILQVPGCRGWGCPARRDGPGLSASGWGRRVLGRHASRLSEAGDCRRCSPRVTGMSPEQPRSPRSGSPPSSTVSRCWVRSRRAGPATSWPAPCSTASARSTSCPSRPPPTPCAARSSTRCSRTSSTCPAADRTPERAARPAGPAWEALLEAEPGLAEMFADEGPRRRDVAGVVPLGARPLLHLEDPRRLEPAERELYVETLLDSRLLLRGFVDRLDVAPDGAIRVVDYKSGRSRRRVVRGQGAVPDEVLRARRLAHPRGGAGDAAADLPRQRRAAPLRPRRARPAGHRAQGRGDLGARSGTRRGDRRLAAQSDRGCATGAPTRRSALPSVALPHRCRWYSSTPTRPATSRPTRASPPFRDLGQRAARSAASSPSSESLKTRRSPSRTGTWFGHHQHRAAGGLRRPGARCWSPRWPRSPRGRRRGRRPP